ncbi:hypothetical protein M409DRAFT_29354 [Zasmidium cellare ATCC 36951]|uniref:Uncharacterized protein n=1 Tax=Zasmidium cellare ATCC 36951 TaxID=1080233 RepID=A0A6A6BZX3_ZASCE|nr:uncharacterized protein M409DRAFT_29354 [Zasmidium cellare ATCC 36951]KAF2160265.1 hypothetical protein M409DRAFT_29354 [Zasmidium cellare ATCC 36951]
MATRTVRPDTHTPPDRAILADIYARRDETTYPTTLFIVTTAPHLDFDILVECKDFAAATKEYDLLYAEIIQGIVDVFSGPDLSVDGIPTEYRTTRQYKDMISQTQ